jgi:hypothetical protein
MSFDDERLIAGETIEVMVGDDINIAERAQEPGNRTGIDLAAPPHHPALAEPVLESL